MESLVCQNLSFTYPGQSKKALDDINITIGQGEFVLLIGCSGSGKTTLLSQLKPPLAPHGKSSGRILFGGQPLDNLGRKEQCRRIGLVRQNPDNQLVTDKVWHELAFGLESLGLDNQTIRRRVAEMASFFGMEKWFHQDVASLSGGQKQLLNLAAVLVMQPQMLLLDEPTAQLDPIAAAEFLATLVQINRELAMTVIISEQRLEEVFPLADRVLLLEQGRLVYNGPPRCLALELLRRGQQLPAGLPTPLRVWAALPNELPCPLDVREGQRWLDDYCDLRILRSQSLAPQPEAEAGGEVEMLCLKDLHFSYAKHSPAVLNGLSLRVRQGDFLTILGGNGAGKSTLLSLIAGNLRPQSGDIAASGRVALLPQNVQALFVGKSVAADLEATLAGQPQDQASRRQRLQRAISLCHLGTLLDHHPYDLSAGEQQRLGLAKVLLSEPEILLLDEPTKGLDGEFKQSLANILARLRRKNVTIIMASHDLEFAARHSSHCALLSAGAICGLSDNRSFFAMGRFYTTVASRMARHRWPDAIVAEDIILACGGTAPQPAEAEADPEVSAPLVAAAEKDNALLDQEAAEQDTPANAIPAALTAAPQRRLRQRLTQRTRLAMLMILLAIPLTIYFGIHFFDDRKYLLISLLILIEAMLPFALVFENRKPKARELVVIAVLCGLGVAGRAAFLMLPEVKPVAALVIIAAVAFGGEAGFLVGAITMLLSNMLLSQGPWTPWQMFAMGTIGFLAGSLFSKGWLHYSRLALSIFGGLAVLIIYGGIMNPAAVIMYQDAPTWQMFITAYATGLPFDLLHAASTVGFLWLLARPMLEKLERVKTKYGLIE